MKRLVEVIDAFMRSDRGLRALGITAGIVLLTAVASIGANDTLLPTTQTDIAGDEFVTGPGGELPGTTPMPTPGGTGTRTGTGPGGATNVPGGGAPPTTTGPKLGSPDLDFGLKTQGVTDTEVKVGISYNQAACGDAGLLEAMLGSATVGDWEKAFNTFARYINDTGGIGGRKYKPMFFDDGGSGCPEKSVAAAVAMADEEKVFMAIPGLHVVSDYVISRKVPVWGGRDDPASLQKYGANGLQVLEPIEPTLEAWASFGKHYLGSHTTRQPPCIIRIETGASGNWDIPEKILVDKMRSYGIEFKKIFVFKDDASTAQQQSTDIALRAKAAGCQHVYFMAGNPVGLIFITNAATQNNWHPNRWTFTSYTAGSDVDQFGALMDQGQWERAVGLTVRVPAEAHPKRDNCKKIYQKYNPNDGQENSAAVLVACNGVLPTAEAMRRGIKRTGELTGNSVMIGADSIRDDFYYDAHVPMSFSFPDQDGPFKTRGFTHWTVADWSSAETKYLFPKFPCYYKKFEAGGAGCEDLRSKFK